MASAMRTVAEYMDGSPDNSRDAPVATAGRSWRRGCRKSSGIWVEPERGQLDGGDAGLQRLAIRTTSNFQVPISGMVTTTRQFGS